MQSGLVRAHLGVNVSPKGRETGHNGAEQGGEGLAPSG